MPRQPRLELPEVPMHVTRRGVNRCVIFLDDEDRTHYLRLLTEKTRKLEVCIHAYVLMGSHIHLLASSKKLGALSRTMRQVGQNYVATFNRRHRRTGTLWEGRFKSCLVDSEQYLLTVYRYIELNPVRAAMIDAPEGYVWSSARANLGMCRDPLVTPHEVFLAIAEDPLQRGEACRAWLRAGVGDDELQRVREHIRQERVLGSQRFQAMAEKALGRPVAVRQPGRPTQGR